MEFAENDNNAVMHDTPILDNWLEEQNKKRENALNRYKEEQQRSIAQREEDAKACGKFEKWLNEAVPGEDHIYHTGPHLGGVRVAKTAMEAYERGVVLLLQKRKTGVGIFEYIARKRGKSYE